MVPKCDCHLRAGLSYNCRNPYRNVVGDVMWVPTQDEAVLIYARFLKAHHGTGASNFARKTAKSLQDEGDLEGHKIWNAVADAVDRPPHQWPQPRLLVSRKVA